MVEDEFEVELDEFSKQVVADQKAEREKAEQGCYWCPNDLGPNAVTDEFGDKFCCSECMAEANGDFDGCDHKDDDGEPCNCNSQECGYDNNDEPICPECGASEDNINLVCGDHGNRCEKCNATFCCP